MNKVACKTSAVIFVAFALLIPSCNPQEKNPMKNHQV